MVEQHRYADSTAKLNPVAGRGVLHTPPVIDKNTSTLLPDHLNACGLAIARLEETGLEGCLTRKVG
jgi:hypothetical protein